MEIVGRIVGVHIDDVGTILYAGLSIDTAGVSRVVDTKCIIIHQFAGIFSQSLSGFFVNITVKGMTELVGQSYKASVDGSSQTLITVADFGFLVYLQTIDNPVVGHLQTGVDIFYIATVIP